MQNKVTYADVLDEIVDVTYTLLPNKRTTICQLTLRNGFTVEGQSACVSIENYDQSIGEKYAYEDAEKNVWPLLGYALATKLKESA